jgi:hypothetical protein
MAKGRIEQFIRAISFSVVADFHVELRLCLRTAVTNMPIVYPQVIYEYDKCNGIILTVKNLRKLREKPVPV